MATAKRVVPEHSRQRLYSVRDLATTLNISRRTLLYYEDLGIVDPEHDDETGYRWYTPNDIFRLMQGIILKNAGIAPKDLGHHLDDRPFSSEHIEEYHDRIERHIAYCHAQRECMDALVSLVDEVGTIDERYIEPYYISYDRAETGYHEFPDDEALISLLQNLPIGGLGNRYTADLFDPETKARWGRTVAARFRRPVYLRSRTDGRMPVRVLGDLRRRHLCRACRGRDRTHRTLSRRARPAQRRQAVLPLLAPFGPRLPRAAVRSGRGGCDTGPLIGPRPLAVCRAPLRAVRLAVRRVSHSRKQLVTCAAIL